MKYLGPHKILAGKRGAEKVVGLRELYRSGDSVTDAFGDSYKLDKKPGYARRIAK